MFRDDATPPMRTEEPSEAVEEPLTEVEEEKEAPLSPNPPTTSANASIAPADYSALSDETQPALGASEDLKDLRYEEDEHSDLVNCGVDLV